MSCSSRRVTGRASRWRAGLVVGSWNRRSGRRWLRRRAARSSAWRDVVTGEPAGWERSGPGRAPRPDPQPMSATAVPAASRSTTPSSRQHVAHQVGAHPGANARSIPCAATGHGGRSAQPGAKTVRQAVDEGHRLGKAWNMPRRHMSWPSSTSTATAGGASENRSPLPVSATTRPAAAWPGPPASTARPGRWRRPAWWTRAAAGRGRPSRSPRWIMPAVTASAIRLATW
jgi:hypothetical protein